MAATATIVMVATTTTTTTMMVVTTMMAATTMMVVTTLVIVRIVRVRVEDLALFLDQHRHAVDEPELALGLHEHAILEGDGLLFHAHGQPSDGIKDRLDLQLDLALRIQHGPLFFDERAVYENPFNLGGRPIRNDHGFLFHQLAPDQRLLDLPDQLTLGVEDLFLFHQLAPDQRLLDLPDQPTLGVEDLFLYLDRYAVAGRGLDDHFISLAIGHDRLLHDDAGRSALLCEERRGHKCDQQCT